MSDRCSNDLQVPDFAKASFSISGLVLTSPRRAVMPSPRVDEQMKVVLPGPPVAMRTFAQNDEIALFAEVYDKRKASRRTRSTSRRPSPRTKGK